MSDEWAEQYCGLHAQPFTNDEGGIETELAGEMIDQAALIGVLNQIYNRGHAVLWLKRVVKPEPAEP